MDANFEKAADNAVIRQLFEDYIKLYIKGDERVVEFLSDNFSGFTGSGSRLVKDKAEWVSITRRDCEQLRGQLWVVHKDLNIQALSEGVFIASSIFTIQVPVDETLYSNQFARLVLVFTKEASGWKISHSSLSLPYVMAQAGELSLPKDPVDRNRELERLLAEKTAELKTSEERYLSILNASPDDITIADKNGYIIMVSPAAYGLFGYPDNFHFLGRHVLDFLAPESRPLAVEQLRRRLAGAKPGPSEYLGLRSDGSTFNIEGNAEFIRNSAGEPTGMIVIVRDITARKRAEAEQKRLDEENRQLQKTESLRLLAGAIAHHFNNHLHAVIMGLELVLLDQAEDSHNKKELQITLNSAREATELSKHMLTYLGQMTTRSERFDLSLLCQQALDTLRPHLPAEFTLASELPSPGPTIRVGANQIEQVLVRLISNAQEAGALGTRFIRVSVTTVPAVQISSRHRFPIGSQPTEGVYACLAVSDDGCGMSERFIGKIFDPFFTSKRLGRGMGLPVVLGIVQAHSGIVTVESEPDKGSIFRVFLPVEAR